MNFGCQKGDLYCECFFGPIVYVGFLENLFCWLCTQWFFNFCISSHGRYICEQTKANGETRYVIMKYNGGEKNYSEGKLLA